MLRTGSTHGPKELGGRCPLLTSSSSRLPPPPVPAQSHQLPPPPARRPRASRAAATWSPLTSHLPFAAIGFHSLFRFLSSGLCFPSFGGQGLPTRRSPPCRGRPLAAPSLHRLYPTSLREGDSPHLRATAPSQGKSRGASAGRFGGLLAVLCPARRLPEPGPVGTGTPKPGTGQTRPGSPLCRHCLGSGEARSGGPGGVLGLARAGNIPALFVLPLVSSAVQTSAGFFEMKIKLIKVGQILRPGPRCWPKQWLFLPPRQLPQL